MTGKRTGKGAWRYAKGIKTGERDGGKKGGAKRRHKDDVRKTD